LVKLKKSIKKWLLPNDFWIAMEKGVANTTNYAGTTKNVPLPFTKSTHPGHIQLREQSKIGFIQRLKGRLSTWWQYYVTTHIKATNSRLKSDELAAMFVAKLLEPTL
jgi:hypothetical protein